MRRCLAPTHGSGARAAARGALAGLFVLVVALSAGVGPAGAQSTTSTTSGAASASSTTSSTAPTPTTPAPTTSSTTSPPSSTTSSTTAPAPTTTTAPSTTTTVPGSIVAPSTLEPEATGWVTGPDVASWQHVNGGPIDWGRVKGAGHSFVFIKATEGASSPGGRGYTNPYFASDYAGAGSVGLYRGAYHFARPMLPISTATDQARQFAAALGRPGGSRDLPPVLDIEITGGLGPTDLTNWSVRFLEELESLTGRVPIVYTGRYFVRDQMGGTTRLGRWPLWVASWTSAGGPGTLPPGWSDWTWWQYTNSANVPGISGAVDMNRFRGSLADLAAQGGRPLQIFQRYENTSGIAQAVPELYVEPNGVSLACDWDGDGRDTLTVVAGNTWYSNNDPSGGGPTLRFSFGSAGDTPVCGDWNGDGRDGPGVFRQGWWYVTDTAGAAWADRSFGYGDPGDTPIAGDWDGDGRDTQGITREGTWFVTNTLGVPIADTRWGYGDPGDKPLVGDWDGDGKESHGISRGGVWYLTNTAASPWADTIFSYGDPGDVLLPGQWRPGRSTPGVVRRAG